jgi:hypothetical protein
VPRRLRGGRELTCRQFRTGPAALGGRGRRGRGPRRAGAALQSPGLPQGVRQRALEMARDPLYEDFGPTLLAEHLERDARGAGCTPARCGCG